MLKEYIKNILELSPEYAAITPVLEKEILHHDIIEVLVKQGAMQSLTFIGGTSLRLCYNSSRLSEYLDFNGGHNFKPTDFNGLEVDIQDYIQNKYETKVWMNKPSENKQGNTSSWNIRRYGDFWCTGGLYLYDFSDSFILLRYKGINRKCQALITHQ